MNKNAHRLVHSRLRSMVMAVAETTTAEGKSASGEARRVKRSSGMRAAAVLAVSAVAGALSTPVQAQIVGAGPSAPAVIQTPNGLPQVNVNKPGGSGVSVNTYNQFDVQKAGAILNNSATMVQTQLGGWINGNPNFGPNDAARIIVNQVNSPNPSQIRGALEIAGARAELVLANPSGIYLDGAGFINTSRATLTTGLPFYGPDGSLVGYNVNRGLVTVAGAGLNASNLDQVDIISRAVQANAAIYAKNLNVIAGANQVNHDTLAATPIAGDGPAPVVAIDVAQLGGMYANRVFLVGNSAGVGVANAGTIAAQAGDLTLQSNGRLVLTGKTTASGNLALSAADGIQNSGTTYTRQSLSASIGTDLTNSGTLAAQQDTSVTAGSVNSTGTLGAGVNNDGAVGQGGNLNLTVSGQLSATGQNAAGGNASLTGASVNLAGSQTTANGNLSLNATAGDVNLSSATTSAQCTVNAKASGTVINDHGGVSSGGSMTLTGASLSNHGGTITQYGSSAMGMNIRGTLDNSASGLIQTNATDLTLTLAELGNAGGTITHAGTGTLTIAPGTGANAGAGALNNASGTIVTKGQAIVQAAGWNNAGGILAAQRGIDATISGHLNNAQGLLRSDASLSLTNGGALSNQGGQIGSTHDLSIAAATLQGGGTYSTTHDANVHLQGDYTAASDTQFNVGHDLAFTLPGTFTNNASLQSVNTLTSLTGKAVLGPYADLQTMYESLMAAGADLSKSLDLPIGASLSADQVAKLTSNVVLMETRVVNGQSVLVPVVYLAQASQQNMNGPLIAATNIDFQNAQSFTNSGTVKADNTLAIQGKQIDNAFGALQSGGLMALLTENDIDLTSANVKAGSLQLDAGKDLILDTATKTNTRVSRDGATSVVTTFGPIAKLDVVGDASITTGGNVQQNGGDLSVGGNLGMNVGGNWDLGAVQTGEHKIVQRANGVSNTDINKVAGSSVSVGGQSSIGVGGDLTARGAQIDLGQGGTLATKGNVTLAAASATSTVNSNSSGSDSHGSYAETLHTSDQALTGTTLKGGDTVNIVSGKDITVSGSTISLDKGNANLLAAGDVNVGAATETHELNSHETHSHSNVVSGVKVASGIDQTMTLNRGSLLSADGVNIVSGKDVNVQGSTIVGTNDVTLTAAHNVRVTTSQDTLQSSNYYDKKESGLMSGGGLSVSVGSSSLKTSSQTTEVSNNGSTIGSLKGNLSIAAGNDLHVTGSDLIAAQNLSGTGANVTVERCAGYPSPGRDAGHVEERLDVGAESARDRCGVECRGSIASGRS
ncbi:filamentous hemagglutinin N-terminal domain-containing protein [Burkholderia gladioli]